MLEGESWVESVIRGESLGLSTYRNNCVMRSEYRVVMYLVLESYIDAKC